MSDVSLSHSVEKIGGTSMLDTDTLLNNILFGHRASNDLYQRIFVVSAYAGITNALLEHKKSAEPGVFALFASTESDWAWGDALTRTRKLMFELNARVLGETVNRQLADAFIRERIEGVRSCLLDLRRLCSYGSFRLSEHLLTVREMLSALGEAHSAYNTALLLRDRGVEARFIDLTGWRDESHLTLDERIASAFNQIDLSCELPIVTGYAQCSEGLMKQYDRGYTEVTMSRIAVQTAAREAIIHKEFHLSSADPNVVGTEAVREIAETNYDVADQLSNMGMEAIHPNAAKGLRQAGIPLRIKNTFRPDDPGALINAQSTVETPAVEIVTGLKGVFAFEFFEQDMLGVKGYDAAILESLKRHSVRIVAKTSNANTITHYLHGSPKAVKRVEADLADKYPSASITARSVSVVSVIGRNLRIPGLAVRALTALARAGIEPLGFNDLMRKVDIQVIVDNAEYDAAIRALHRGLIENSSNDSKMPEALTA